jgi:hypothetical protein
LETSLSESYAAKKAGVSMRTLDRALWQFSKKKQKG